MRVNSVKWVQNLDNYCQQQDFVSCSTDNTAILWQDIQSTGSYKAYEKLIGNFVFIKNYCFCLKLNYKIIFLSNFILI